MAYVEHEWVNGETITAEKMNNIEEGIAEAAQSGGSGYDLVLTCTVNDTWYSHNYVASDFVIAKGTVQSIEAKVASGGFVTGLLIINGNNKAINFVFLMSVFDISYTTIFFKAIDDTYPIRGFDFEYDPDTYELSFL